MIQKIIVHIQIQKMCVFVVVICFTVVQKVTRKMVESDIHNIAARTIHARFK